MVKLSWDWTGAREQPCPFPFITYFLEDSICKIASFSVDPTLPRRLLMNASNHSSRFSPPILNYVNDGSRILHGTFYLLETILFNHIVPAGSLFFYGMYVW